MPAAPTAKTKSGAVASGDAAVAPPAAVRRRRRVPGWLLASVSAALAIGYGVFVERMRMGPPLVMLGLGGMTLALAGMALWRVIDPLTRAEAPAAALAPRAPQRLRELEREKQIVLKAIKEIELDYQMRKIAEPDYRDMIGRYRARAMRLISELEAGDNYRQLIERELKDRLYALAEAGGPAAPSTTAATKTASTLGASAPTTTSPSTSGCPTCNTVNDSDAHFCKSCGVRLAKSS
ncbi:MAG: hypothetical protein QOI66_53 [Myxococcales bacterium]|nr:hypothetical protein [Myxococcales bacterium]